MVGEVERRVDDEPELLIEAERGCLVGQRGLLVSVRRAMLTPAALQEFRAAVDVAARAHPSGLVLLSAFRLDERFPLQVGFDADLRTFVDTLRAVDGQLNAIAALLEFGGVRAQTMRVASRAVWALSRPRSKMGSFDRLSDAAQWLAPHACQVDAPDDLASVVRLYRTANRALARIDSLGGSGA